MPSFSLEQKQRDGWASLGYGTFENWDTANQEALEIAKTYDIPIDEIRVRAVEEIPASELRKCDLCSGLVVFTSEMKYYCRKCNLYFEYPAEPE